MALDMIATQLAVQTIQKISKFRLYAIHNFTHCMKQNRKAQKLLTLFRHRERDKWSDQQQQLYATMQASEDRRNREESIFQRTQNELSQEPSSTTTIQGYNKC